MNKPSKTAGKAGDNVPLLVSRHCEVVQASSPDPKRHPGRINGQTKPRKTDTLRSGVWR